MATLELARLYEINALAIERELRIGKLLLLANLLAYYGGV
jgi:hypothetical protein